MKEFKVKIEDLGMNGEGIGRFDGKTCFVPFSLTGEEVLVYLQKEKDNLLFCTKKEVLKKSDKRVEPKCPYFERCGGCTIEHLDYEESLDFKTELVKNTIKKISGEDVLVSKTVASENNYCYRTKNVFPVCVYNDKVVVGMYERGTRKIVEIDKCLLANDNINKALKIVKEFLNADNKNILQARNIKFVVVQSLSNQVVVTLVATKMLKGLEMLSQSLKKEFEKFGLFVNINQNKGGIILDGKLVYVAGIKCLTDESFGIKYEISPFSFMQVNLSVKEKLYKRVLVEIKESDVVIDAYSGAGLLSSMIAKKAKQVVGIEIVKDAVINADKTKEENNIQNLTNICGDCKKEFNAVYHKFNPTVVVLDPPQKGVEEGVLEELTKTTVDKIIYVSCNPKTLARDLKVLLKEYKIKEICPFDMFPNTAEVETIVVLKRK